MPLVVGSRVIIKAGAVPALITEDQGKSLWQVTLADNRGEKKNDYVLNGKKWQQLRHPRPGEWPAEEASSTFSSEKQHTSESESAFLDDDEDDDDDDYNTHISPFDSASSSDDDDSSARNLTSQDIYRVSIPEESDPDLQFAEDIPIYHDTATDNDAVCAGPWG
jgi:hypothetical protein